MKFTLITLGTVLALHALPASAEDNGNAAPSGLSGAGATPTAATPAPLQKATAHVHRTGTRAVAAAERGVRRARVVTERGIHKAGNVVGHGAQKAGNAVQRRVEKVTGPAQANAPAAPPP